MLQTYPSPILTFETVSLSIPGLATAFSVTHLTPSLHPSVVVQKSPGLMIVPGIRTQVLMLVWQTLYTLSHLPSPLLSLKTGEILSQSNSQFLLYWAPDTLTHFLSPALTLPSAESSTSASWNCVRKVHLRPRDFILKACVICLETFLIYSAPKAGQVSG